MLISRQQKWLLFLALATGAVYLQTVGSGAVQLDDPHHIFENRAFYPPSLSHMLRFWIEPFFGMYIPFTYSVWQITALFSKAPWAFHLLNVTLHLINTCLVFSMTLFLLNRGQKSQNHFVIAFLSAAFFCVHPLQAESVAWISGTKDVLFGTMFLLALHFQLQNKPRKSHLFFFLALTSKPTAMIGPAVLFIAYRWFLDRNWEESFRRILPWTVMILPFMIIAKFLQADFLVQDLAPTWSRPLVALDTVWFYVTKTVFPKGLALDYGRTPNYVISLGVRNAILVIVPVLFGAMYFLRKKLPEVWGAFCLFILGFLPVSGLVAFQYQLFSTVADRYTYFSLVGGAFMLAFLLKRLSGTRYEKPGIAIAGALLVLLGVLGARQVGFWRDDTRLFERALKINPNSFLAHNNYAFYLFHTGNPKKAAQHFEKVIGLRPKQAMLRMNYGVALLGSGEKAKGISVLEDALKLEPNNAQIKKTLEKALSEK